MIGYIPGRLATGNSMQTFYNLIVMANNSRGEEQKEGKDRRERR
jgi:hypothetical protein